MRCRLSLRIATVVAVVGLGAAAESAQVGVWQVGKEGLAWESQSEIAAAVDLSQPGLLQPSGFTATDNIAALLNWVDGAPEDMTREGQARVWDNVAITASNRAMVDGNAATSTGERFKKPGVDQTGRIFYFDLGASFPAERIVFYPSGAGEKDFARAFEISLNDGRHFSQGRPVYEVLRRVDINPEPKVEIDFAPQLLRFIKLRVLASNPFEIAEMEVYGQGFVPRAQYLSRFIDFDAPVNFGILRLSAESVGNGEADAVLTVRNGTDLTPLIYYRVDFETQEEIEVSAGEYTGLVDIEKGAIRYDSDNWSNWSRPLEMAEGGVYELDLDFLPGPRRYFQFRLDFTGSSVAVMRINSLSFTYSSSLARNGLAEVARRDDPAPAEGEASAVTGERAVFLCGVRGLFDGGGYRGFDGIHLETPVRSEFMGMSMGGLPVEPDSVRADGSGLWVYFPTHRVTAQEDPPVWMTFATTPLLYNTLFRGWLLDTEGGLPQPLQAGDVGPEVGTSSLNVFGSFGQPLRRFALSAGAVTPNGDGINDRVEISYDLIYLVEDARVELAIYDLAGRMIGEVFAGEASAGSHSLVWDGRDRAGERVPPGNYLCRIEVETQSESFVRISPVVVAY